MNPMITPAPGPNFFPMMEFRQIGNQQVSNFTGWQLLPIPGQPGQRIMVDPKVPASARPYPNAWKHTTMWSDKKPGTPLPDGSGSFGIHIPGTNAYASDGSAFRAMPGMYAPVKL